MSSFFAPAALSSLIFAGALAGATPPAPVDAPAVASLLAQMRQASGGDRWETVRALHIVAEVQTGAGPQTRDRWEDVTAGRYLVSDMTSVGRRAAGFDGITAWRLARSGIAYTLGDVDARLVAADESYRVSRGWWFPDRHPATIALVGERTENGRSFDVLTVTPEGGRAFEAWVDHATHLLARTDEQQAQDRVVASYSDYRAVDGVMIPFDVRSGDGHDPQADEIETVRTVEINPATPETRYALPALPAADIALPKGQTSVEVPFRLTATNRIIVKLAVNGHPPIDAEFDSGGSLVLQPGTVAALGATSGGHLKTGGGGEGSITSGVGVLDSVAIGGASISHVAFHSFAFDPDAPNAALVGQEILQRFVVRFDFDRMRMTLTAPEAFRDTGQGVVVPFHFQDNQPEVKGTIDGIAGLFAIDTGDSSSLLLIAPFAKRYDLVERYHADIPYGGLSVSATHGVWARTRVHTLSLDGADGRPAVEAHDPVTRISLQTAGFDANRNVSGNIGLGFLRQFNLTFDYPHQRLILEKSHFYGRPDIFNRTGLRLKRDGAAWTVSTVYPDSPAQAAGVKPGDRIETIDGLRPDQLDDEALAAKLKGPRGSRLSLMTSDPERRPILLVLRDIL